ncbi:MAG: class I SAM-dependent methyltransferase [Caldilineales bacterium]
MSVQCRPHARVNPTVKAALYSVARIVDAEKFLCLDADMLVLGDLSPIFAALDACPAESILAVREGNARGWHTFRNLQHALTAVYGGHPQDLKRLLGTLNGEGAYELVVNDGLFAGSRSALLTLDGTIRSMPRAVGWTDARRDIWWRNQFVFNLALARLQCGVPLNNTYNIQLNSHDVELEESAGRMRAVWYGQEARVLHFNGLGRKKYPAWRNRFSEVVDPLVETGGGDGYAAFLHALRGWIGRQGRRGLAWSFYGTGDSHDARVADPDVFPLLALLHYLIRANGCARVLETGTARGISAACLASAVAHREDARVVTFDPAAYTGRAQLWQALPDGMRDAIEERRQDSLQGMADALAAGEQFDAALLDSLHEADHIWAEFQLARQLVCPGGLILIHDVRLPSGTVEQALQRIEAAGYGVTRLWTADCGVREDDGLGLAVIANRRRQGATP